MDVVKERFVIVSASFDGHSFVAVAKEPPPEPMPDIEAARIGVLQPFHSGYKVRLRGLEEQMVMVAHEDPGVDAPAGHLTGLSQSLKEETPVVGVAENGFPAIAARHDMVERARVLDADAPGHD